MTENILEVKGLVKDYGDFALDHLSFELPRGAIMGLIGENGAAYRSYLKRFGLSQGKEVRNLSKGMKAKLSFAVALVVLGIWSNLTDSAVMHFVVDNFDACMAASFAAAAILWVLSCLLSTKLVEGRR